MSIIDFFKAAFAPYPDPTYGLTLKEQHAKQAFLQAKLEKERKDFLENVFPQIKKQIGEDSMRSMEILKERERKLYEGFKPP